MKIERKASPFQFIWQNKILHVSFLSQTVAHSLAHNFTRILRKYAQRNRERDPRSGKKREAKKSGGGPTRLPVENLFGQLPNSHRVDYFH